MPNPDREKALALLQKYTKNKNLLQHAYCVEAVMRHYAEKWDEDSEKWGIIGLVHDLDYDMYPDEHCHKSREIMEEEGWPQDYIRAVMSHGWSICTDIEPEHRMEKLLFASDELTGLIYATALVRPSKSILDLTAKSVKKKWKQASFAAGADRNIILKGCEMLGMERDELITECIEAMKKAADLIGLAGV